jgi:hypothetical protein
MPHFVSSDRPAPSQCRFFLLKFVWASFETCRQQTSTRSRKKLVNKMCVQLPVGFVAVGYHVPPGLPTLQSNTLSSRLSLKMEVICSPETVSQWRTPPQSTFSHSHGASGPAQCYFIESRMLTCVNPYMTLIWKSIWVPCLDRSGLRLLSVDSRERENRHVALKRNCVYTEAAFSHLLFKGKCYWSSHYLDLVCSQLLQTAVTPVHFENCNFAASLTFT